MRFRCLPIFLLMIASAVSAQSVRSGTAQRAGAIDEVAPAASSATPSSQSADAAQVLELERNVGAGIVRGDAAYFDSVTSSDFVMVHGDGWTTGGRPALVDDKASFMHRIANKSYAAHDYDSVNIEMHGDVAITYGRYVGNIPSSGPGRAWFSVWYEKIYAKRNGRWLYISHRTVNGAHYGLDRESVSGR